jgi:dTDP-4-dehydrorhamnose reductase
VVNDQRGSPTWTCDLASALVTISELTGRDRKGVEWGTYHFCGSGNVTWYGFAQAIISEAARFEKLKIRTLLPVTTREYYTPAPRPSYSVLDCEKISRFFGIKVPPWRASLHAMVRDLPVSDYDSYRPGEIILSQGQHEVVSGSCCNHSSDIAFRSK